MTIVLLVFAAGAVIELGMLLAPGLWPARKWLASASLVATAFVCGGLVMWQSNFFSLVFGGIGLYRIFNDVRIVEQRMHEAYLLRATRRTAVVLLGLQAVIGLAWWGWQAWNPDANGWWTAAAGLQLVVAGLLWASTAHSLRRTRWPATVAGADDSHLPTISVAIPARNETEDLQACLESIIPSNYLKLEILVLDDCSQDRRTPEIIRSYAHDGVRFVKGDDPQDTWLAKNQAYDKLAREASGDYILFCGVDVRFAPDSIGQLVAMLRSRNKQMLSVLPRRADSVAQHSALAQAMRYFWEVVPPRRLFNRPPVLSTCWIICKQALQKAGGFEAVARSIVPEAFFAKQLLATDGYSFMRAGQSAGIESTKAAPEQRETAVRTRYPQLHRRPENVLLLSLALLGFVLLPFGLAVGGQWLHIGWTAQLLAGLAAAILTATYSMLSVATRTGSWQFGLVGLPLGVLYDIGLLHYSMWQYEFSTVEWKGRNVCIPAMHVIPHLPPLPDAGNS